jgi:hypothetical protein
VKEIIDSIDETFYRFKNIHKKRPVLYHLITHKFIKPLNLTAEHIAFLDVLHESLKENINNILKSNRREKSK